MAVPENLMAADDPVAAAAVAAIQVGDVDGLRGVLDAHPQLVNARVGSADESRTLLHVATDWPGHFPRVGQAIALVAERGGDVNAPFVGAARRDAAALGGEQRRRRGRRRAARQRGRHRGARRGARRRPAPGRRRRLRAVGGRSAARRPWRDHPPEMRPRWASWTGWRRCSVSTRHPTGTRSPARCGPRATAVARSRPSSCWLEVRTSTGSGGVTSRPSTWRARKDTTSSPPGYGRRAASGPATSRPSPRAAGEVRGNSSRASGRTAGRPHPGRPGTRSQRRSPPSVVSVAPRSRPVMSSPPQRDGRWAGGCAV